MEHVPRAEPARSLAFESGGSLFLRNPGWVLPEKSKVAFYLPFVMAGIALIALPVLLRTPTWAKAKISPRVTWLFTGLAGAAGVGWGISYVLAQMNQPSCGPVEPLLAPGTQLPPIEAEGWINGPPRMFLDKTFRVLVVDIRGQW